MSENNVETRQEFNKVWVSGIIEDEFEFSHEVYGKKFYKTRVRVKRLSGVEDFIPIMVPEILITDVLSDSVKGKCVEVVGQFRSYNKIGDDKIPHVQLFVFVKAIDFYQSEEEIAEPADANLVYLDGYICKPPVYRETPLGREITDLLIAVNRDYNKSDYIPCIAWGRSALYLNTCEVGDRLQLEGRVQSRKYLKRTSPDSEEGKVKVAYEISIQKFYKIEPEVSDD